MQGKRAFLVTGSQQKSPQAKEEGCDNGFDLLKEMD
jgi:hypothetical protein